MRSFKATAAALTLAASYVENGVTSFFLSQKLIPEKGSICDSLGIVSTTSVLRSEKVSTCRSASTFSTHIFRPSVSRMDQMKLHQSTSSTNDNSKGDIIKDEINGKVNGNGNGVGSDSLSLNVMTWNILADALATNEFVTLGGDTQNVAWNDNRDKEIGKILTEAFTQHDMSVVATHENDHPQWLLHEIRKVVPSVDMCFVSVHDESIPTKYERCYIRRVSNAVSMYQEDTCALRCNSDVPGCSSNAARTKSSLTKHYQTSNQWLQTVDSSTRQSFCKRGITCTTNAEEHVLNIEEEKKNYLYIPSAAGTVLYYDTRKVTMIQHQIKHQCVDFATKESDVSFTVFAAHLKSGINLKAEKTRSKQLTKLLTHAQTCPNPILLLDANSCLQYLHDLKLKSKKTNGFDKRKHQWTTDVIQDFGFVNVVPDKGNECLKLRNYATYQPQKAGQFMFDTLDQILVLKPSSTNRDNDQNERDQYIPPIATNFLKLSSETYPTKYYDDYVKLRNTPSLRRALRRLISDQKWESDIVPFLPHIKETFASYVEKICEEDKIDNDVTLQHDISDLLSHLYPKAKILPSDHPPVGASIELQCLKSLVVNGNGLQDKNGKSKKEAVNGINGNDKTNKLASSTQKDQLEPTSTNGDFSGINGNSTNINGNSISKSIGEKEKNLRN